MRLYHRSASALVIRQHGFMSRGLVGFSDRPLSDSDDPATAGAISLAFDVPEDRVLPWEVDAPTGDYRLFRVAPTIANTFFPIVDQLSADRVRRTA
jgi:hypothetical protein